jgi:hypothetical protein
MYLTIYLTLRLLISHAFRVQKKHIVFANKYYLIICFRLSLIEHGDPYRCPMSIQNDLFQTDKNDFCTRKLTLC